MAEQPERKETSDGTEPAPWRSRYSRGQKAVALLLGLGLVLLLVDPFLLRPRARHLLSPYPRTARPHADTGPVEVTAGALRSAERIVAAELERQAFPGAALAVGQRGRVVLERGYGRIGWRRVSLPVDPDRTLYDLSSLTKVLATTTAVMLLVDDGRMRLDDPVSRWLPVLRGEGREKITVRQVLNHTSGLPAGRQLEGATPNQRLEHLVATVPLVDEPGKWVLYSDVGFAILGEAAARAAGEPLPAFLRRRVWGPLGMAQTHYQPGRFCPACAPTLSLRDGTPFAGKTNDELARELGGVAGNAGLFATAHDVGRFAAMLANGGELGGVRIVREATLRAFARPDSATGTRALGFEVFCREGPKKYHQPCREPYAYGHTGYTGTSLWIDPERGIWVVLLTNRTYLPRASNRLNEVRREIYETVTGNGSTGDADLAGR